METRAEMNKLWREAKNGSGVGKELHDVTFFIVDDGGECLGKIPAHKFVLSLGSEVFRTQFSRKYAALNKEEDGVTQVEIKDTSFEAFEAMIEFLYRGDIYSKYLLNPSDLNLLFQILCLADKYFLDNFKKLLIPAIEWFPVSSKNYASVYKAVEFYKHMMGLETLCADLWDRCVLAVRRGWKSADDSVSFWSKDSDNSDDSDDGDTAANVALMQRLSELSVQECTCGLSKIACLHGEKLTAENCEVGMIVKAISEISPVNLGYECVVWGTKVGDMGVVREFCNRSRSMSGDKLGRKWSTGVLSVEWEWEAEGDSCRAIHASYHDILIESHGNGLM
jgi:hypothetical protein